MELVYDVAHNIAKFEDHVIDGKSKRVWVHRKGATRAFPPDHPETPAAYRAIGQPVIIPGDMGRASWVLVGQPGSMQKTFGSACHGAGRVMSRTAAVKNSQGRRIDRELAARSVARRAGRVWPRQPALPSTWWSSRTPRIRRKLRMRDRRDQGKASCGCTPSITPTCPFFTFSVSLSIVEKANPAICRSRGVGRHGPLRGEERWPRFAAHSLGI
jgi:hypothetical protein